MKLIANSIRWFLIVVVLLFVFFSLRSPHYKQKITTIFPHVQTSIESSEFEKYKDLNKLYSISVALEKYKIEHRSYPLSENEGKEWGTYIKKNGAKNEIWINGLVPKYLDKLPTAGVGNDDYDVQFRYKSNGANYKLIFTWASDCDEIKLLDINLIEKHSNSGCGAYGFWTKNASEWRW